ncbi:MAG: oxidative damage protection protein [Methylococcaceae bacterium]
MVRMIKCAKLGIEAEGLDAPPFPGSKGKLIYEKVSKQAWEEWIGVQTMLINENKLASYEPQARKFLEQEREKFFFGKGVEMPEDYVPPKT